MADYQFGKTYKQDLPEFQGGGGGLTGVASGLVSGYQAAQAGAQRREDIKNVEANTGLPMTQAEKANMGLSGNRLTDLMKGFLGASGVEAEGRNPLLKGQEELQGLNIKEKKQQMSLEETLNQNLGGLLKEFSSAPTTEDRLQFLQRNAGLAITPQGQKLFGTMAQVTGQIAGIESKGLQAELQRAQVKDLADLANNYGYDGKTPESLVTSRKNRHMLKDIAPFADKMGVVLDQVSPDWFDAGGNLDLTKAVPIIAKMPKQNAKPALDLTAITPQPLKDEAGNVVAYAMPNGTGGVHYVSPSKAGQVTFGTVPGTSQKYVTMGGGLHLIHDPAQEAELKIAGKGLEDVEMRKRDLESNMRLSEDKKKERLAPLLKQEADLRQRMQSALGASAPAVPVDAATAPSPQPLPSDRTKWVKDQPYFTNKGTLIWDGTNFRSP